MKFKQRKSNEKATLNNWKESVCLVLPARLLSFCPTFLCVCVCVWYATYQRTLSERYTKECTYGEKEQTSWPNLCVFLEPYMLMGYISFWIYTYRYVAFAHRLQVRKPKKITYKRQTQNQRQYTRHTNKKSHQNLNSADFSLFARFCYVFFFFFEIIFSWFAELFMVYVWLQTLNHVINFCNSLWPFLLIRLIVIDSRSINTPLRHSFMV